MQEVICDSIIYSVPSPSLSPESSSPSPSPTPKNMDSKWTLVQLEYTVGLEYYITSYIGVIDYWEK